MLQLKNLAVVKNARINENISFTGVVANSRKGTFTISPVLADKLEIGEGDSAILLQGSAVDANGKEVSAFYLAKGLKYEHVLDENGQPVRQEKVKKYVYKPNTGFGSVVRETESKMFAFTNAGVWNTIHGNSGVSARFQVSNVEQTELNTKDLGEDFDKTFITNIVEILVDTKKEKKSATRTQSAPKTASVAQTTNEVNVDAEVSDVDDFEDDDFGDDE